MSSTVVIQVGQCGNQLGESFFDRIYHEATENGDKVFAEESFNRYFNKSGENLFANAVLVDMEYKVISKCLNQQHRKWLYNSKACVSAKQGSGNNWANGYCNYGSSMEEEIRDAVRVISDQLPSISTVFILMSSAGGTGSGLGCKITELVKDSIPGVLILNHVVLPFSQGEVAVQCYNMLLTLSSLYENSDSLLLLHNDQYQHLSSRLLSSWGSGAAKGSVSFREINDLMASHIFGSFSPSFHIKMTSSCTGTDKKEKTLIRTEEIIQHLVPHPGFKLLTCRAMPVVSDYSKAFTNTSWEMLGKYSRQMVLQNSILDEGLLWSIKPKSELTTSNKNVVLNTCVSNFVVCHGVDKPVLEIEEKFVVSDLYRSNSTKCLFGYSSDLFQKLDKSIFVVSNAVKNGYFLEKLLDQSWSKIQAKAFMYQYEAFGLDKSWFMESFSTIQKVSNDYSMIMN